MKVSSSTISHSELVASREQRRSVLSVKYLQSQSETIEAILKEEEDERELTETVAKIVAFGKTLATEHMNFAHPMMFRTSKKDCRKRMGAQICPRILLDKNGVIYMSYGPNTELPIGSRLRRSVPQVVIPIKKDAHTLKTVSLLEIRLVSKKLRDHLSIDWDYDL